MGIEAYNILNMLQLMPVKSDTWILHRVVHQHRVWYRISAEGVKFYAITLKVKASASVSVFALTPTSRLNVKLTVFY